jgi:molybdenum cofactor biosynthesis enzyme
LYEALTAINVALLTVYDMCKATGQASNATKAPSTAA